MDQAAFSLHRRILNPGFHHVAFLASARLDDREPDDLVSAVEKGAVGAILPLGPLVPAHQ
jgi:hypothetical protein